MRQAPEAEEAKETEGKMGSAAAEATGSAVAEATG
jgi:hypothetical protein